MSKPWADHPELVEFFTRHRSRAEELYRSERRFLPWLAAQAVSICDVGCAVGGFSEIWRAYRPDIAYTGVDLSPTMISAAKTRYPNCAFLCGNAVEGIALPDRSAVVVQALGWLHWEPAYAQALEELWRLTSRYLFFDVRLVAASDHARTGQQKIALTSSWDGASTTPYLTVAWPPLASLLLQLKPARLLGYGYWGKPADTVTGIDGPVCFATFVMEKPVVEQLPYTPQVCVDLPWPWPDEFRRGVSVAPASQLERFVPLVHSSASAETPDHGREGMRRSCVDEMSPMQAAAAKSEPRLRRDASPKSAQVSGGRRRATRDPGLAREAR